MQRILDLILQLLSRFLPASLVPNRKVLAAGVTAPAIPVLIGLLKLMFPVVPRWLDFLLHLVGGAAPVAAAYTVATKPLGTKPGTTRVV